MTQSWFRMYKCLFAKAFDWGWWQISWQGWSVVLLWFFLMFGVAFYFDLFSKGVHTINSFMFLASLAILSLLFTLIARNRTRLD